MELVFRGEKLYDLFVVLDEDGSAKLTIRSKNATGESSFSLKSDDVEKVYNIRSMIKGK